MSVTILTTDQKAKKAYGGRYQLSSCAFFIEYPIVDFRKY
jgi:hypothetical protein